MRAAAQSGGRFALAFAFAAPAWLACASLSCVDSSPVKEGLAGAPRATPDAGGSSSSPDAAASDCVLDPQTHEEIINACTDAVKIAKSPALPLLLPDGGLPPLP